MKRSSIEDYVKIPKQEYNLLKEVYRTVKRQAFLVRINEAERHLAAGKTKSMSVDNFIANHNSKPSTQQLLTRPTQLR